LSDSTPRAGDTGGSRFIIGCEHRVVNDHNPALATVERVPLDDLAQELIDQGLAFEDDIFEQLCNIHRCPNLRDHDDTEEATLAAMKRGDRIIVGLSLPTVDHRSGKPDVLLRHGEEPMPNGKWAYLPVDVKNSQPLEGSSKEREWLVSTLQNPWVTAASPSVIGKGKPKSDHSMQLAHYWLMLADLGHAPAIAPIGATINPDLGLVWRELDEAGDSCLELARREWNRRWLAINTMRDGGEPLTRPFLHSNCDQCVWRDFCEDIVVEEEHVSLLSGVGEATVRSLASVGIHLIPELAACDPNATSIGSLKVTKTLASAIDTARVFRSNAPTPFLKRGGSLVPVPRADVEVDFDIENDRNAFVYLYGCHVSERVSENEWTPGEYVSFHTFNRADPEVEAHTLVSFWNWLHDLVARTQSAGKSIAVYCYSGDFAELPRMKEAVGRNPDYPGMPTIADIEQLGQQPWWVDMHKITKNYLWPTRTVGLKYVARLAGFEWDAEDAGGANSIVWFMTASNPDHPDAQAMADKLLRYNADDVLATRHLRQWLDDGTNGRGWSIQPVETLDELN